MTGRELVAGAGSHPAILLVALAAPALIALLLGFVHRRGDGGSAPWTYVYSLVVYATCIPGMLAAVLVAYTLFFSRESLMDQNVLVFFAPIVAMGVTLWLVRKNVAFDAVPGFDRISGLMTMIGLTFVIVLAIEKTRILVVSLLPVAALVGLCVCVFALIRWGASMAFRDPGQPKKDPPGLRLT